MRPPAAHLVLIDIDAFDPRYLSLASTPNIGAMASRGSLGIARGVFKSFSNPARSSIITGAWPRTHHNQAYYYDPDRDIAVGQERPYDAADSATPLRAETIAQVLRAEGRTAVGIEYHNLNGYGIEPGDPEHLYATPAGDCAARIDAAIDVLYGRPVVSRGTAVTVPRVPDLLALYLKDFDDLGHAEGPFGPGMPGLVAEMDRQLGRLVRAVAAAGLLERTAFLLVSDHGMVHIAEPVLPELLRELDRTGLCWEVVPVGHSPSPASEVVVVATSRNADLTLRGAAASPHGRRRVADAVRALGDRAILHDADDLARLGALDRVGDLVAEAVSPHHFGADTDRPAGGGHGGSAEMDVPLVVSGAGIRAGAEPVDARLVDIAPTACALLGVRPPANAEGRVLAELFTESDH